MRKFLKRLIHDIRVIWSGHAIVVHWGELRRIHMATSRADAIEWAKQYPADARVYFCHDGIVTGVRYGI